MILTANGSRDSNLFSSKPHVQFQKILRTNLRNIQFESRFLLVSSVAEPAYTPRRRLNYIWVSCTHPGALQGVSRGWFVGLRAHRRRAEKWTVHFWRLSLRRFEYWRVFRSWNPSSRNLYDVGPALSIGRRRHPITGAIPCQTERNRTDKTWHAEMDREIYNFALLLLLFVPVCERIKPAKLYIGRSNEIPPKQDDKASLNVNVDCKTSEL